MRGRTGVCRQSHLELHLSCDSDFISKGWGKKVKEAGGEYTYCRGHSYTRFVFVPLTHWALAENLVEKFPHQTRRNQGTTVVARIDQPKEKKLLVYYAKRGQAFPVELEELQAIEAVAAQEKAERQAREDARRSERDSKIRTIIGALETSPLCELDEVQETIEELRAELERISPTSFPVFL